MLRRNPVVPRDRPLIAITYKYNARKVLFLISTDDSGITKAYIPYLFKCTDQFEIFSFPLFIFPLSCLSYLDLLIRLTPKKIKAV